MIEALSQLKISDFVKENGAHFFFTVIYKRKTSFLPRSSKTNARSPAMQNDTKLKWCDYIDLQAGISNDPLISGALRLLRDLAISRMAFYELTVEVGQYIDIKPESAKVFALVIVSDPHKSADIYSHRIGRGGPTDTCTVIPGEVGSHFYVTLQWPAGSNIICLQVPWDGTKFWSDDIQKRIIMNQVANDADWLMCQ